MDTATTILPTDPHDDAPAHVAGQPETILIPYGEVIANSAENRRRTPPDPALEGELASDMAQRIAAGLHPQKQPVEVEQRLGKWHLVSGFTRHRVIGRLVKDRRADTAEWAPTLWASVVAPRDDYDRAVINLRENLLRSELPPADLAEAVSEARARTGREVAEIARDIGRPLSSVANIVRAYERTTPEMWSAFRKGAVTQKQVIALAALQGEEQRISFDALMSPPAPPSSGGAAGASTKRGPKDTAPAAVDDASPTARTIDLEDEEIGGRVRYVAELLNKAPGLKDSTHDFAAGMRTVVRFCLSGSKADQAALGARIEALQAQLHVRETRPSKPQPAPTPDARQLEIAPAKGGTLASVARNGPGDYTVTLASPKDKAKAKPKATATAAPKGSPKAKPKTNAAGKAKPPVGPKAKPAGKAKAK